LVAAPRPAELVGARRGVSSQPLLRPGDGSVPQRRSRRLGNRPAVCVHRGWPA